MRSRSLGAVLAAALLLSSGRSAFAAFEDLGVGARAPGMGDAFVAIADDVYAIHYNPAGLGLIERPMLGTSYSSFYLGLTDKSNLGSSFVGYVHPLQEGRHGTVGAAWDSFSLNGSLYQDQTLSLSYGAKTNYHPFGGDLYAGANLKYLYSSFGSAPEAASALNGLTSTGKEDPALTGRRTVGAVDTDAGLLYRFAQRYSLGLAAVHVNTPNVAFVPGATDRLPLQLRVGLDYHNLVTNVAAQIENKTSPLGTQDRIFTVAGERWFPMRFIGDFAVRGALGIGSRNDTKVNAGVSYRTQRMQVDYAFSLPINGIASTAGSHRVAVGFRFGKATDEEESLEMVLEEMRRLTAGHAAVYKATGSGLTLSQKTQLDEYLAQARTYELSARYKDAFGKLSSALSVAPADPELVAKFSRLNLVSQQVTSFSEYKSDPFEAQMHQGLLAYLAGDYNAAVEKVYSALKSKPNYHDLDLVVAELKRLTGVDRPTDNGPVSTMNYAASQALTRANSAIQDGDNEEAIAQSLRVLQAYADNANAWENLGTAYFALNQFADSINAWTKALQYEKDSAVRSAIKSYLKSAARAMERKAFVRRPTSAAAPVHVRAITPQQRQKIFEAGVDHFTHREFPLAKEAFETLVHDDPDDVEAQKALRRVIEEMQ